MHVPRTERARHTAQAEPLRHLAPRAAALCRLGSPLNTRFAPFLLVFVGILPAAGLGGPLPENSPAEKAALEIYSDIDNNGVEDLLDQWLDGQRSWQELRDVSGSLPSDPQLDIAGSSAGLSPLASLPSGAWGAGGLRVVRLGGSSGDLGRALAAAGASGRCDVIHSLERFGGVEVLGVDEAGLAAFLIANPGGRILLDRDGTPALAFSRPLVGADQAVTGHWTLGEDWSTSVAILDSGCDTAHGDLGDFLDDDLDGPAPYVGDSGDWWPAASGWPTAQRYKVVGWQDVTDDFPLARGPWDYHHHGTALASVVAGSGLVESGYRGLAPNTHLTVVKFYDFDDTWHAWAGDFLAACAWTLDNLELYRIRTVLIAVNWTVDAGISEAMSALLDEGVLPVVAMGNYGPDTGTGGFPASLSSVLTVGAVNGAGAVSAFSGRGIYGMDKPDLLAPGGGLLRTGGRIMVCDNEPNDTYSERQGTSLAAAHAAGALSLLDEALRKSGLEMPADRASAMTRKAILKATCARIALAENDAGTANNSLPEQSKPDPARGWGLLRVDAAVEGALMPLLPGREQEDYIASGWWRPVVARRLMLHRGVQYRIEARPASGLDVAVEMVDPRWLEQPAWWSEVIRHDAQGVGGTETVDYTPDTDHFLILAVKQVAGSGSLWLKVSELAPPLASRIQTTLPGTVTGAPNYGVLNGLEDVSLVIPSLVQVDPEARALSVLDSFGNARPNWPIFLFPHPSSQGGLTQPLVWNFDGILGDEIVVASKYGSLYFFTGDGLFQEVALEFNLGLTAPVGLVNAAGKPVVATVDRNGRVFAYSLGPVLEWMEDLPFDVPMQPAVGQLTGSPLEELVVSFANGNVVALDGAGNLLPGWPVNLGTTLASPPVLCDLDNDGFHEIVQPVWSGTTGSLGMRVLRGDGSPGPGDGASIPPSGGGRWKVLSAPAVAGRQATGDLRIVMSGLAENGQTGAQARWSMDQALLYADGTPATLPLPGFALRGISDLGNLELDMGLISTPICWNSLGGSGPDPHTLVHLRWQDVLNGLTSVPGGMTAWLCESSDGLPLTGRQELVPGGPALSPISSQGGLVMPLDGEFYRRLEVTGRNATFQSVSVGLGEAPAWTTARGDARNSGAYPLTQHASPVAGPALAGVRLSVSPNPASSRLFFQWEGPRRQDGILWEVFDLRGRRLRSLRSSSETGAVHWDATDQAGRPLAAGSYLVRARSGNVEAVSRVVLQR